MVATSRFDAKVRRARSAKNGASRRPPRARHRVARAPDRRPRRPRPRGLRLCRVPRRGGRHTRRHVPQCPDVAPATPRRPRRPPGRRAAAPGRPERPGRLRRAAPGRRAARETAARRLLPRRRPRLRRRRLQLGPDPHEPGVDARDRRPRRRGCQAFSILHAARLHASPRGAAERQVPRDDGLVPRRPEPPERLGVAPRTRAPPRGAPRRLPEPRRRQVARRPLVREAPARVARLRQLPGLLRRHDRLLDPRDPRPRPRLRRRRLRGGPGRLPGSRVDRRGLLRPRRRPARLRRPLRDGRLRGSRRGRDRGRGRGPPALPLRRLQRRPRAAGGRRGRRRRVRSRVPPGVRLDARDVRGRRAGHGPRHRPRRRRPQGDGRLRERFGRLRVGQRRDPGPGGRRLELAAPGRKVLRLGGRRPRARLRPLAVAPGAHARRRLRRLVPRRGLAADDRGRGGRRRGLRRRREPLRGPLRRRARAAVGTFSPRRRLRHRARAAGVLHGRLPRGRPQAGRRRRRRFDLLARLRRLPRAGPVRPVAEQCLRLGARRRRRLRRLLHGHGALRRRRGSGRDDGFIGGAARRLRPPLREVPARGPRPAGAGVRAPCSCGDRRRLPALGEERLHGVPLGGRGRPAAGRPAAMARRRRRRRHHQAAALPRRSAAARRRRRRASAERRWRRPDDTAARPRRRRSADERRAAERRRRRLEFAAPAPLPRRRRGLRRRRLQLGPLEDEPGADALPRLAGRRRRQARPLLHAARLHAEPRGAAERHVPRVVGHVPQDDHRAVELGPRPRPRAHPAEAARGLPEPRHRQVGRRPLHVVPRAPIPRLPVLPGLLQPHHRLLHARDLRHAPVPRGDGAHRVRGAARERVLRQHQGLQLRRRPAAARRRDVQHGRLRGAGAGPDPQGGAEAPALPLRRLQRRPRAFGGGRGRRRELREFVPRGGARRARVLRGRRARHGPGHGSRRRRAQGRRGRLREFRDHLRVGQRRPPGPDRRRLELAAPGAEVLALRGRRARARVRPLAAAPGGAARRRLRRVVPRDGLAADARPSGGRRAAAERRRGRSIRSHLRGPSRGPPAHGAPRPRRRLREAARAHGPRDGRLRRGRHEADRERDGRALGGPGRLRLPHGGPSLDRAGLLRGRGRRGLGLLRRLLPPHGALQRDGRSDGALRPQGVAAPGARAAHGQVPSGRRRAAGAVVHARRLRAAGPGEFMHGLGRQRLHRQPLGPRRRPARRHGRAVRRTDAATARERPVRLRDGHARALRVPRRGLPGASERRGLL